MEFIFISEIYSLW